MKIDRNSVLVKPDYVMSVAEFIEKYHAGVKPQSIYYAMDNDNIDWVDFGGREKSVVMTDKTRLYIPNESKKREANNDVKPTTTLSL